MPNNAPTDLQTMLHAPHSHSPSGTFLLVIPAQEKWYHLNFQFCPSHPIISSFRLGLLIPHPTGKIDEKKNNKPHPLAHKKMPKPLVTPINAPYFPAVGGWWGFQLTGALRSPWTTRSLVTMPWIPGDHAPWSHVTFSFHRMKIIFIEWKYIFIEWK